MIKVLLLLFILLTGCSEIRYAKADRIRSQTRRANEIHDMRMADKAALAPTRIEAEKKLLVTASIAGIVLGIVLVGSASYYLVGLSVAKVKQINLMRVPLDDHTKQYPLIISNGDRAYNPNTLSNSDLWINSLPYPEALRGSQAVQMIGAGARYKSYGDYEKEVMLIK